MQDWSLDKVVNTGSQITILLAMGAIAITVFVMAALEIQKGTVDYKWPLVVIGVITVVVLILVFVSPYFYTSTTRAPTRAPTLAPTRAPTLAPTPTRAPTLAPTAEPVIDICLGTAQSSKLGVVYIYFKNIYTLENTKSMLSSAANGNVVIYSFRSNLNGTYVTFDVAGRPSTSCIRLQPSKLGPIYSFGTDIGEPTPLSIDPIAFYQQSITPLPPPPLPTSAPTAPTAAPTSKPAQVCIDTASWKDANGNSCSFYSTLSGVDRSGFAASNLCNSYGVDPSLAASGTGCSVFTTQTSCESYGVRPSMCSFVNGKCIDKPIVAWQACCNCGGGVLTPETLPPTLAPTQAPTAAPTAAPTQAPVAVQDQVLGISGLVSLDTSPVTSNRVKLYMYRLSYFTNTEAKDAIEEAFGGSLPSPIGQYPKFNSTLGRFESIPNAVVNTPNVPNYGNFEFTTEPVEGLTGVYYLFLMYSCNGGTKKKYPLYTDRVIIPGVSYDDPAIYFTEILIDGTANLSMFECINFNFDCLALPGNFKENNKYTLTVPPKYTNGAGGIYNPCSFKLFLEKESIEQSLFFMFLLSYFLGIANLDNMDNVNKMCPTYYADCVADTDCLQELESQMANKNIGMQTGVDWGSDPTKSELESADPGATFTKFGYLNACVIYKYAKNMAKVIDNKNNRFVVKSDQTCDFMKTYYEHCKVTTSDNDEQIMQTMSQDEYDKYVFNKLFLENYTESFCMLQRVGFKLDFDLSSFIKENPNIYPDGTTIPPELNEIFYGLNAYEQIKNQCTTTLP